MTSLNGKSYAELRDEYITLAKTYEDKATKRRKQVERVIYRDLMIKWDAQPAFWKGRDFETELDLLVDIAASDDKQWRAYVGSNQWYISQATMFATAASSVALDRLVSRGF
jgi:hypothetical protein